MKHTSQKDISYNKKIQLNNYTEKKILSYYFSWDIDKVNVVYNLSHRLKSDGFEVYIRNLLNKVYNINLSENKCERDRFSNKWDGWIDGIDRENQIFLQCKKYRKNIDYKGKVSVVDIRDFIGAIMTEYKKENKPFDKNISGVFVTTWLFTSKAIELAKIWWIICIDYREIVDIYYSSYTLKNFESEFSSLKFPQYYNYLPQQIPYFEETIKEKSLEYYLKSVREFIAFEEFGWDDSKNGFVFEDTILKTFLERYKDWKKKDFSLFDTKYKIEMKKALEIWES